MTKKKINIKKRKKYKKKINKKENYLIKIWLIILFIVFILYSPPNYENKSNITIIWN